MSDGPDAIAAAKAALRKQILARRDGLSAGARAAFSATISARVSALDGFQRARALLAYMSFGSEFDTGELIEQVLAQGKTLLLPRVERGTHRLSVHVVRDLTRELQAGAWGIREPRPDCARAQAGDADWILVPGLAFTARGERLGYGAGYYDRLIAQCVASGKKPALVAAAFSTQMVPSVPVTETDQCVDLVITEDAAYPC